MARIAPLTPEDLPEARFVIDAIREDHGYVPNSFLTMARQPSLIRATGLLADALWYSDSLPQPVRRLVSFAFSFFSGAMYSAAHTAHGAEELGLSRAAITAIARYETDPVFLPQDRALLRLCRHAARMPGEVTDADVEALRAHFDDAAIVAIVGLIAWHAFLNRWNAIMATTLEEAPRRYAEMALAPMGWHAGVHG